MRGCRQKQYNQKQRLKINERRFFQQEGEVVVDTKGCKHIHLGNERFVLMKEADAIKSDCWVVQK